MENFTSKTIAALLTVSLAFACDLDLDFRCTGTDGHYVIINPDTDTYIDVQAYHENGDECDATIEGTESDTLTVSSCGTNNVQIVLSTGDGTTTCTISCEDGTRSQAGYTLPLQFVLQTSGVLRSGSAHYYCHDTQVIFIKNPRQEVYYDSVAYSYSGNQLACDTTHSLQNSIIEVSGCDTTGGVLLGLRKNSNLGFLIRRQSDIFYLDCGLTSPPVDSGDLTSGADYQCFADGTIVVDNPRSELYKYSWAEQGGIECTTIYVKKFHQVLITNCDYTKYIILALHKKPITAETAPYILRTANVFMFKCSV